MPLISPSSWKPVGVKDLEDSARHVVSSTQSALVTAGPGAGKTELLAQRAVYLLQTGQCRSPQRILAISFKRDAARNVAERVRQRCGTEGRRFESLTLDAFAKGLLDRFRAGLPPMWTPLADYEVFPNVGPRDAEAWLRSRQYPPGLAAPPPGWGPEQLRRFLEEAVAGAPLPPTADNKDRLSLWVAHQWWAESLGQTGRKAQLTFAMIARLAELIVRSNPFLRKALLATYAYVFLDEFQDTTQAHYELVRTCFMGAQTVLTAVGDTKQRIMVWAGAMQDVFAHFERDFAAKRYDLTRNYRSAPALVRMQQVIAEAIEHEAPKVKAVKEGGAAGFCQIWEFPNSANEAATLAELVKHGVDKEKLRPRDFCILVRQKSEVMSAPVVDALRRRGIRARDESVLQDLLTEPVSDLLLAILRLATRERDSSAWTALCDMVAGLHGWSADEDAAAIGKEASRLVGEARALSAKLAPGEANVRAVLTSLVDTIGEPLLRALWRQYTRGTFLRKQVDLLGTAIATSLAEFKTLRAAIDDLLGADVVPAMTIHKSKGLEFHTVIFVGLEDSSWWSFASQSQEDKRAFFVAFSRAKERVIFTFSDVRNAGRGAVPQRRTEIDDLYSILHRAKVPRRDWRKQVSVPT